LASNIKTDKFIATNFDEEFYTFENESYTRINPGIFLGFGRSRVLWDKIYLEYGADVIVSLDLLTSSEGTYVEEEFLKILVGTRAANSAFFRSYVSIGFMPLFK